MIFELPYILVLYAAFARVRSMLNRVQKPMSIIVVAFILFFALMLARDAIQGGNSFSNQVYEPGVTPLEALIVGVVLTGANPFFLMWWTTVGAPIIEDAVALGKRGLTIMYASHVWIDYVWLTLLASTGGMVATAAPAAYSLLLLLLSALLLLFAADILLRAFLGKRLLPL